MQHRKKYGLALAIAAALAAPSAFATNGYFSHGYSIKEKGMVGIGAALPQDSLAAATNPAGMVMVGSRLDVGASLFSPIREYDVSGGPSNACQPPPFDFACTFSIGPQSIDSDAELFLIPHFGWNKMLTADSSIGVSVYGNGGMNTRYKGGTATFDPDALPPTNGPAPHMPFPGTFGGGALGGSTAGVDLAQLFFNVTYAQKITPSSSWGISGIFAYQQFEARGLSAFSAFSTDPSKLTDNGHDKSTGFGAKIGVLGEVAPGVSLGASYQTKMSMSEFDDYKGLFAEKGGFDIPATATAGLSWRVTPDSALAFDVQRIWYSKVDSIANPFNNLLTSCMPGMTGGTGPGCLGGANGVGFGWEDMTIYKLGYQWQTSPAWIWRVGYSQGDQPIPNSEVLFNILAPGVMEKHITFGFTNELSKSSEWSFMAMYAPEEEVKGTNPLDPAQTITLKMKQYEVGASWGMKF